MYEKLLMKTALLAGKILMENGLRYIEQKIRLRESLNMVLVMSVLMNIIHM